MVKPLFNSVPLWAGTLGRSLNGLMILVPRKLLCDFSFPDPSPSPEQGLTTTVLSFE